MLSRSCRFHTAIPTPRARNSAPRNKCRMALQSSSPRDASQVTARFPTPPSTASTPSCPDAPTAILIIGLMGAGSSHAHMQAALALQRRQHSRKTVVIAAGEARDPLGLRGLAVLKDSLAALALVSTARVTRPDFLQREAIFESHPPPSAGSFRRLASSSVHAVAHQRKSGHHITHHHPTTAKVKEGAKLQWHKYALAWQMLERVEARNGGQPFEIVIKLRFDATPLLPFRPCPPASTGRRLVVYAATDKIFWGRRAAMVTLAPLFSSIAPAFEGRPTTPPTTPRRAVHLQVLFDSAVSLPVGAWSTSVPLRQHYNKFAMLPYPTTVSQRHSIQINRPDGLTASESRSEALDRLTSTIRTRGTVHDPYAVGARTLSPGPRSSGLDRAPNVFVAERDFLLWLLWNNVTVCDLGAQSTAILYKGVKTQRGSSPCPV